MCDFKMELEYVLWYNSLNDFPIFRIEVDSQDCMTFINVLTNQCIYYTNPVVNLEHFDHGVRVTTKSGNTYELYDVTRTMLETSSSISCENVEVVKDEDESIGNLSYDDFPNFVVSRECKHINYGDGYNASHYTFNEPISEEDFKKFCILEGHNMKYIDGGGNWYEDYAKIENRDDIITPGGTVIKHNTEGKYWTYKWIRVYTD